MDAKTRDVLVRMARIIEMGLPRVPSSYSHSGPGFHPPPMVYSPVAQELETLIKELERADVT